MAYVCAYRAAGNDAAAKALYVSYMEQLSFDDKDIEAKWESMSKLDREPWRNMFRAGHQAYRKVIQEENRRNDLSSEAR